MARKMRMAPRTVTPNQWQEMFDVFFGDDVSKKEDSQAQFDADDNVLPRFYCERCDKEFLGESQDVDDVPERCPFCKQPPLEAQAITVADPESGVTVKTFPFFQPRPDVEPEFAPPAGATPEANHE